MPIYDYRCDHCGHAFSAVQSFKDEQLEKCPNCGKRPRRLFSAPALVFKGSGWYKTDSRASRDPSAKTDASKSESSGESSGESKSESSGESKSDAKSGTKSEKQEKRAAKPDKPTPKSEAAS